MTKGLCDVPEVGALSEVVGGSQRKFAVRARYARLACQEMSLKSVWERASWETGQFRGCAAVTDSTRTGKGRTEWKGPWEQEFTEPVMAG